MTVTLEQLRATPNALAAHYSRFRVDERILLTGHSHQAWPDCCREAQLEAWDDAARYGDDKWSHAFAKAAQVQRGFARVANDPDGHYTLGENTHTLLVQWLSALPLRTRPRIVTTDGEFHSARRQLQRLAEEGIEIHSVASVPAADVADKLIRAIDNRTAAVIVSSVFYHTGHRVPELGELARYCAQHGVPLLVDVYHHLNVVPLDVAADGLGTAYFVGGGYKYCQLGEGNCFLRLPPDCQLRPVITGWFAEFQHLASQRMTGPVPYEQGALRFAGATYDPTAHYRAARVFEFFDEQGLTPQLLHSVNRHQLALLADGFDRGDTDPNLILRDKRVSLAERGGFLTFRTPFAAKLKSQLAESGVIVDNRGDTLRIGPAPYCSDAQLTAAVSALVDLVSGTGALTESPRR